MARRLLLALLGASAALWAAPRAEGAAERPNAKCGTPKDIANAVPEESGNMRLRYTCVRNYKRQAGTSSLTVCQQNMMTKEFEWTSSNLICIKDPSKPLSEFERTTEDTRKETEAPTSGRQPVPPGTSASPAAASRALHGRETTSAHPGSSTAATRLWMAESSPDRSTAMASPQKTGGGILGTEAGNGTPWKRTATQGSRPESWNPAFSTFSTEISTTMTEPSGNTPDNTTWLSKTDIPKGQTGSLYLQTVFLPIVLILLAFSMAGLWYFLKKHGRFRRQRVTGEIPTADRGEEMGQMIPAGQDTEDAGPADEGVLVGRMTQRKRRPLGGNHLTSSKRLDGAVPGLPPGHQFTVPSYQNGRQSRGGIPLKRRGT